MTGRLGTVAASMAWELAACLPEVWREAATEVRARSTPDDRDRHSEGLAAGLEIAADQLNKVLSRVLAVMPPCIHGVPVNEDCTEGCW